MIKYEEILDLEGRANFFYRIACKRNENAFRLDDLGLNAGRRKKSQSSLTPFSCGGRPFS